jgi:hypothetical protein
VTSAPPFYSLHVISETFTTKVEPRYATILSQNKQKIFFATSPFAHKKNEQNNAALRYFTPQTVAIFTTETSL